MVRIKYFSMLLFWCCTFSGAVAQTAKYFIEFTDKKNSPYSIQDPSKFLSQRAIERRIRQYISPVTRDLPVNPAYLQAIQQAGGNIWYSSKWMNAVVIDADSVTLIKIKSLPFVKPDQEDNWRKVTARRAADKKTHVEKKQTTNNRASQTAESATPVLDYGFAANQVTMIGADEMHKRGFTGKDMWIAVLDAGFRNADQVSSLTHLFTENRILATYDFVEKETSVYEDDSHGLQVLSAMAAYKPGEIIGTAFGANYLLFRTEQSGSEYRIEEINWLLAAEYADSAGVDVINSSLGYNLFSNSSMNYSPADMDGNTALITRAADMAAATGMLVVNSAGNEGNDPWQTIAAPADADSVLTVGAVNLNRIYAPFSSRGPSADKRIKPNLSAQGQGAVLSSPSGSTISSNGTSFSAPILAGMAASFWQAYPQLTNMQVIDLLQRSASQSNKPDSLLGYGIPNFNKAAQLADEELKNSQQACRFYPNPVSDGSFNLWVNATFVKEPLTIRIFDALGKVVNEQKISAASTLNTISLPANGFPMGTYILQVISPSIRFVDKFVKM